MLLALLVLPGLAAAAAPAPKITFPPVRPVISGVSPYTGHQGSTIDLTITGTNFQTFSQVWLTNEGGDRIDAWWEVLREDGSIWCGIEIPSAATTGYYHLWVSGINADGVLANAFTVTPSTSGTVTVYGQSEAVTVGEIGTMRLYMINEYVPYADQIAVSVTFDSTALQYVSTDWEMGSDVSEALNGNELFLGATAHPFPRGDFTVANMHFRALKAGQTPMTVQIGHVLSGSIDLSPYTIGQAGVSFVAVSPPPNVVGVSPEYGGIGTTVNLVVSGNHFDPSSQVWMSDAAQSLGFAATGETLSGDGSYLTCQLPIPSSIPPGAYDVRVSGPGGQGVKSGGFLVTAPITVTGIAPNSGRIGQALSGVIISGSGFRADNPPDTVALLYHQDPTKGVTAHDITLISPSQFSCSVTLPSDPNIIGPYDLVIGTRYPNGGNGILSNAFTVTSSGPSLLTVPGASNAPRDLNGDGKYEDVNGNSRKDFADITLYFNQITWIGANEPLAAFDYNGNGRIDFADVTWLFNHL
jgi:hypothetical protein